MMHLLNDPTFWVLIAFTIFVIAVYRRLSKIILGALDKRAETIRSEIDNAHRLVEEATALQAEQRRRADEIAKEIDAILAHGREEAVRIRAAAQADIQAVIKRREAQAVDRIALVEAAAIAEVRSRVVDVAIAASRQLLAEANRNADGQPDPEVDAALGALPKHLN